MKVFLLHRDRDFVVKPELRDAVFDAMLSGNLSAVTNVRRNLERQRSPGSRPAPSAPTSDDILAQDLELETLWNALAAGDEFLFEVAKRAVLSSLADTEEIRYRQHVLADCLEHPQTVREIYALAMEALDHERTATPLWSTAGPDTILHRSVRVLKMQVGVLRRLRELAEGNADSFRSEGFTRFLTMLKEELADGYLNMIEHHLDQLGFKRGVLQSAQLAKGIKARRYIVRQQGEPSWRERLPFGNRAPGYSFDIHPRDEAGFRALDQIRGKAINQVANAVAQSAEHIKSFFAMLRIELAFYLGCQNVHDLLIAKGEPFCFPDPAAADALVFTAQNLYDVCLSLHIKDRVVGSNVNADGKSLVVVTGANQGGKSTLLRGVGVAHLMMQSGMFVGAQSFRASVCASLSTHYKREEDTAMEGGKLDEELRRMSEIADQIMPTSLLLCNESFASTNEREGSEIARQVVRAMIEKGIKVIFVTHMYDLAHGFYAQQLPTTLFLRAERQADGSRSFRLSEREPLPTSYGEDSYRRVFGPSRVLAVAQLRQ